MTSLTPMTPRLCYDDVTDLSQTLVLKLNNLCCLVPLPRRNGRLSGVRRRTCGVRRRISGVRRRISGVRRRISGVRRRISGVNAGEIRVYNDVNISRVTYPGSVCLLGGRDYLTLPPPYTTPAIHYPRYTLPPLYTTPDLYSALGTARLNVVVNGAVHLLLAHEVVPPGLLQPHHLLWQSGPGHLEGSPVVVCRSVGEESFLRELDQIKQVPRRTAETGHLEGSSNLLPGCPVFGSGVRHGMQTIL